MGVILKKSKTRISVLGADSEIKLPGLLDKVVVEKRTNNQLQNKQKVWPSAREKNPGWELQIEDIHIKLAQKFKNLGRVLTEEMQPRDAKTHREYSEEAFQKLSKVVGIGKFSLETKSSGLLKWCLSSYMTVNAG